MTLEEIRTMLGVAPPTEERDRLLARLEAFESVVGSWYSLAPSAPLRTFTITQLTALRVETARLLGVSGTYVAAVDPRRAVGS